MNARIPVLLFVTALACVVRAQATAKGEDVRLTLHPAAPGQPALKDALLPEPADQTPGNAATVYLMAFDDAGRVSSDPSFESLRDVTIAELDEAKASALLNAHTVMMQNLAIAARRSACEWDPPTREQGLRAVLTYPNQAWVAGNLLSIRAKLAMKRRHFDEAIDALRDGFALADHLEREPLLVQALVAASIRGQLLADARELAQQPGAPNLYWPLVNLPPAGRNRVRIVQTEKSSLFLTFPELRHVEQLSAAQSRQVFADLQHLAGGGSWAELLLGMVREYPQAKRFLIEHGRSPELANEMPPDTAVLSYYLAQFIEQSDEMNKRAGLPLWQACAEVPQPTVRDGAPGSPAGLHSYGYASPDEPQPYNPLLATAPAYHRAFSSFANVERERAMLQVVEGIRAYAAAHDGALPRSLDVLSPDTPAPLDPMLNRPFDYQVAGDAATLAAPAPPGEPPQLQKSYHITIAH